MLLVHSDSWSGDMSRIVQGCIPATTARQPISCKQCMIWPILGCQTSFAESLTQRVRVKSCKRKPSRSIPNDITVLTPVLHAWQLRLIAWLGFARRPRHRALSVQAFSALVEPRAEKILCPTSALPYI